MNGEGKWWQITPHTICVAATELQVIEWDHYWTPAIIFASEFRNIWQTMQNVCLHTCQQHSTALSIYAPMYAKGTRIGHVCSMYVNCTRAKNKDKNKDVLIGPKEFVLHMRVTQRKR